MIFLGKITERFNVNLEVRAVFSVVGKDADERSETLRGCGYLPIVDHVKLRLRRTISIRGEVMTDPFDSVAEEVALLWVERNVMAHKRLANALEIRD